LVSVNFALEGANGDTIVFDYSNYVLNPDFMGFNLPPSQVRIEESAGDGGVFRHAKRGVRNMDIPITVIGTDRADVQTKLRRLGKLLQNVYGPLTLQARYSDGVRLNMQAYYTGGAEGQWGSNGGNIWARWTLSLQAPQPYWQSNELEQFTVTQGSTGRGLLPELSKLQVSSSQAFGQIIVDNTGDVPTFPTYRVEGPITGLAVTDGVQGFSLVEPVDSGETIYVNTETGEVYDQTGANRYNILDTAPRLFRLPVGSSSVTISGTDVDDNTRIDVYYPLRYEVVH
tara:strand:- start:352 stop:1206 length:855 start_codon:yes stop_codon:yes gene_type:complete